MKNNRRFFLKISGLLGLSFFLKPEIKSSANRLFPDKVANFLADASGNEDKPIIGTYGNWASGLLDHSLPSHSFRRM